MSENKDENTPTVIILGAGPPYRGVTPSILNKVAEHRRILDWVFDAFSSEFRVDFHFVGGYLLDEVIRNYPSLNYSLNPDWKHTGSAASLYSAPLSPERSYFVCYSDVIFSKQVVSQINQAKADIVLGVDLNWVHRYPNRSQSDLKEAEKLRIVNESIVSVGKDLNIDEANAEYIGLMKLSPKAVGTILSLKNKKSYCNSKMNIPNLIEELLQTGLSFKAVNCDQQWAELNAPQDLARFVLGTKAETLERLSPLVRHSVILGQVHFTTESWKEDARAILNMISEKFGDDSLIVRSSALTEDTWSSSNAGAFLSAPDIPGNNPTELSKAIDQVIRSFNDDHPGHQVLVQPMLQEVALSGVVFTRTLNHGAPYRVINYDVSSFTDSITGGYVQNHETLLMHRGQSKLPSQSHPLLEKLPKAIQELESLVGHDSLDIEFAITENGKIHILQLRPLSINQGSRHFSDEQVQEIIDKAAVEFDDCQTLGPYMLGDRAVFGVMPDWNPAEIIGIKPKQLALSLYRHLVTNETWAIQRTQFGYRDVRPYPLMLSFAGHPYIDIRTSFNSFIPEALSDDLANRLVNHYLNRLIKNPHFHDKVEFEIVFSAITLDFDSNVERLRQESFNEDDINALRNALVGITQNALDHYQGHLDQIELLENRLEVLRLSKALPLDKARLLLDDCRRQGVLPFAHLARLGFIAVGFLRSAVNIGLMTREDVDGFLNSLNTVAKQFKKDVVSFQKGEYDFDHMIKVYGHLRPGTYEITSKSYAESPEDYLKPIGDISPMPEPEGKSFSWSSEHKKGWVQKLKSLGLNSDFSSFESFLIKSIEGRERAKFAFTRNLSHAMDCLIKFGGDNGLSREQISHIAIGDLLSVKLGIPGGDVGAWLKSRSEEGEQWHELTQAIELPPLINHKDDLFSFQFPKSQANFITSGKVVAEKVQLIDGEALPEKLSGKIAMISRADPGYDWLFGKGIVGMITMFGGANSHMAIRAAEFGLPSAIGVGQVDFEKLLNALIIELDCAGRRIQILR